jgi:hypothetical protein
MATRQDFRGKATEASISSILADVIDAWGSNLTPIFINGAVFKDKEKFIFGPFKIPVTAKFVTMRSIKKL